jgi:hypothetical protein
VLSGVMAKSGRLRVPLCSPPYNFLITEVIVWFDVNSMLSNCGPKIQSARPKSGCRSWTSSASGSAGCFAELLRVKAELSLHEGGGANLASAERGFLQALELAHQQGALSWELRAAIGIARLPYRSNRSVEARQILASTYDRFTEGFETADLRSARELLG